MSNKTIDALRYIDLALSEEVASNESNPCHNLIALEELENSFYQALTEGAEPSELRPQHDHIINTDSANDSNNSSKLYGFSSTFPSALLSSDSFFTHADCLLQFKRGMDEANKFLPEEFKLCNNLDKGKEELQPLEFKDPRSRAERCNVGSSSLSPGQVRLRKNRYSQVKFRDRESKKRLLTTQFEEDELSALLDGLYIDHFNNQSVLNQELVQHNRQSQKGLPGGATTTEATALAKLSSLLMSCAQAIASDDHMGSVELLKKIRQQSTPFGYGCQRLAHYFANGLEARIDPNYRSTQRYLNGRLTTGNLMKAQMSLLWFCPFRSVAVLFANQYILNVVVQKNASTLHLIDFDLYSGLQWALLIQSLSAQPDGPPKLRVTEIRHPQWNTVIEQTAPRLSDYCKHFGVPFQYQNILKKWETIEMEDLKVDQNEATVVVALGAGFDKLLDEVETDSLYCARDAVLKLVRKINPDIFIHLVNSGSYNVPAFVPRFRAAFYHYLSVFGMLQSSIPADKEGERLVLEKEFYGTEVFNIIAHEGPDRVERAETYAKWQSRTGRAGFQQLPLDEGLVMTLKQLVKNGYHEDYVVEEDGNWLAQGWRGRALCAICCWIPSP